jgi:hypothetical protein
VGSLITKGIRFHLNKIGLHLVMLLNLGGALYGDGMNCGSYRRNNGCDSLNLWGTLPVCCDGMEI